MSALETTSLPYQYSLFDGPPGIPESITGLARYKLATQSYYKRLRSLSLLAIEIIATLLILGLLWITVYWVKAAVTIIAILFALILLYLIGNILY